MDTVRIYGLGVMKIRIWFMLVVQVGRRRHRLGVMDRRVKTMNNKGFILGYIWLFYVFFKMLLTFSIL